LRLNRGTTISLELEKYVIERFLKECGQEFVEHSQDILEQYSKSAKMQLEYKTSVLPTLKLKNVSPQLDFEFIAVSHIVYPFQTSTAVASVPKSPGGSLKLSSLHNKPADQEHQSPYSIEPFTTLMTSLCAFFRQKEPCYQLSIQPGVSQCTLAYHPSPSRTVYLEGLSQSQAMIIQGINQGMSIRQISECIGQSTIDTEHDLALLSSIDGHKIIDKIDDSGLYKIGHALNNITDKGVLRFNNNIKKEEIGEKVQGEEKQTEEKKAAIQSMIVRILKVNKKRAHLELFVEVNNSLSFELEDRDFRKFINDLINLDYIKKDETNSDIYHYIP
jgi:hypothetical protein